MSEQSLAAAVLSQAQRVRADFLASDADLTWDGLLREPPGVVTEFLANYGDRADALRSAHEWWNQAGRPASFNRRVPVQTAPAPRPGPTDPLLSVEVPKPDTVNSLQDLARLGPVVFNAFSQQYPSTFAALSGALHHGR